jgi:hypothetical protein
MKTLRDINKALKPHNVRLYKGSCYLYMTYDTNVSFESKSFYGGHFASLSPERWVEEGIDFADRCFLKVRENV